jgi:diguanylate cyclase (GGDEF)-like protein
MQVIISIIFLLLSQVSVAQVKIDLKQFNQVAKEVKELKKTDLGLSLKRLAVYDDLLDKLTIDQNIIYFKLLTEIYIEQNKYKIAKEMANKGLTIAKSLASPNILISELLYLKGFAFENLGDIPQATQDYKKGLEVADSLHHKVQVASGLINLGAIAYLTNNYKRSLVLLNDAYNIAGQTDDEILKGHANSELGSVYSALLQDEQSMAYYQQSYLHFKKAGMLLSAHNSLNNIALNYINNENYQQAIHTFKIIIAESNKDSPSDDMYRVYSGMAWVHLKKEEGNPEAAYEYILKAKQYLKSTENLNLQWQYYIDEAYILYKLDRLDEVLMRIAQIEKVFSTNEEKSLIKKQGYINIINLKSEVYYKQGHFKKAYQTTSSMIALKDKLYENEDNRSVAQVRLRLEGEQADKQNKVLYGQQMLHEANLYGVKLESEEQRFYFLIGTLVSLALFWVLVKLLQSQHKLKVASNIDALTGVANRHRLMNQSQKAFKVAQEKQTDLSVLMIDVDHLKNINNSLGHSVGDSVLAQVASLGVNMMRKSDVFGRFGGEEFMVCLPKTTLKSAIEIGERIRLCISQHMWNINQIEQVSISIGVSTLQGDSDLVSMIKRADEQLYQAKASGRNKVCGE